MAGKRVRGMIMSAVRDTAEILGSRREPGAPRMAIAQGTE
jgi:hypothetical protein